MKGEGDSERRESEGTLKSQFRQRVVGGKNVSRDASQVIATGDRMFELGSEPRFKGRWCGPPLFLFP